MTIAEMIASLQGNPYFGAGAGLFGVGILTAVMRKGSQYGMIFFRRQFMMSMEVSSRDQSYDWVSNWIATKGAKVQHLGVDTIFRQSSTGRITTSFKFVPGPGNHFFFYKRTWIQVEKVREKQMMDFSKGTPLEFITLKAFGRDKTVFFELLEEAKQMALTKMEGKTVMFTPLGSEWRPFGFPRRKRPMESVILDTGISDRIYKDVVEFIRNPMWYYERGIPYRRGYLLYGPPGCGKSSYITALAGALDYSICVLSLNERALTDDRLNHLLATAPDYSIILIEDIDCLFENREDPTAEPLKPGYASHRPTLSGVLNALDGVASSEARVIFMTTNYLERLDPALIRPGRVDIKVNIDYCTSDQISNMYQRFYPEEPTQEVENFVNTVLAHNKKVSTAQIQGLFLQYKTDPDGAKQNTHLLWTS